LATQNATFKPEKIKADKVRLVCRYLNKQNDKKEEYLAAVFFRPLFHNPPPPLPCTTLNHTQRMRAGSDDVDGEEVLPPKKKLKVSPSL
jgi:hypothetical protein